MTATLASHRPGVAAVVLAAGFSTRMGTSKPLMPSVSAGCSALGPMAMASSADSAR